MTTDYNAASWTASELAADVFRKCRLPVLGTVDYTPAVILNMATQSIHDWAGHMMTTAGEGRMGTAFLRAMTADAQDVAGTAYFLPPMAAADAVVAVLWVDPVTNTEKRLEGIPDAMLPLFTRTTDAGIPHGYAFMDGGVTIFPRPSVAGTLKFLYQRRHGVLTADVADYGSEVLSFATDPAGCTITVAAAPVAFVAGVWLDVIGRNYPYRIKVHGARVSNVAGDVVTINTPFAEMQKVNPVDDLAILYGKTPYVHLPLEMREPLTQQVSSRVLSEIGDMPISVAQDQMATAGALRVRDMLSPRAKSQPQKLYNPNSIARGGHSFRRRWPGV